MTPKTGGSPRAEGRPGTPLWPSREARAAAVRALGPALQAVERQVRTRRVLLRWSLQLQGPATRFLRHVQQTERARTGGGDYREAGRLLREYLRGEIAEAEVCKRINRHLATEGAPAWVLRPTGKRLATGGRFVLDWGSGWLGAWRDLARLLGDGATLGRLRVCALPSCGALFYDASPRGDRRACSQQHKAVLASRAYRQRQKWRGAGHH